MQKKKKPHREVQDFNFTSSDTNKISPSPPNEDNNGPAFDIPANPKALEDFTPTAIPSLANELPSYHHQTSPSAINSTASVNAIAPTKSHESFATLRSLLDCGDVYTATYSHWSWEREDDLAIYCSTCREGRCAACHGGIYFEEVELGDKLTRENRDVSVCTPCVHGFCSGGTLRLVTRSRAG